MPPMLPPQSASQHGRRADTPSTAGRDVPVFLERSVIDFRCVMVDHIYREKLVVRNGANTAMKLSVPNRPDVADYFEFSPNFGFVQVRCRARI